MLSPDYLARVMEGAEEVASQLHTDILKDVMRRLMARLDRGEEFYLTSTDKWQLETLMESGKLREEIIQEIAKRSKTQAKVVRKAFEDAGIKSLSYDASIYDAAGLSSVPLRQSPMLVRMLHRMYEATMGDWVNITRTTADSAQRLFIERCDRAYNQVMSGAMSRSQAVRQAVEEIAKDGIEITYPSGHKDTVETATARAVRTGISQGAADITLERAREFGVDLVLTSSHLGARPTHEPWQGKVFHVDFEKLGLGKNPSNEESKYPDLVEVTRYGYVDGLCGANCRHSMVPYIEGVTTNPFEQFDTEENRKQYEIEQKQREIERKIRKVKREVQGLQEAVKNASPETKPGIEQQYQKRAQRLSELNKEYKQYCEDNKLKTRQERLHIAGWDRKQAAQASGAATERRKTLDFIANDAQNKAASGLPKKVVGLADETMPYTLNVDMEKGPLFPAEFHGVVPEGATLTKVEVMAGYGTSTPIRDLSRLYETYNKNPELWEKKSGTIYGEGYHYVIHWYENNGFIHRDEIKLKGMKAN